MPTVVVSRPILWEVANVVEQGDTTPDDYEAAARDDQVAHGLLNSRMHVGLGLTAMREIRERAQVHRADAALGRRRLSFRPSPAKPCAYSATRRTSRFNRPR